MQNQTSPLILTFGVTDPVGALGIQADLASFAAMGCHGLSVITGILIGDSSRIEEMDSVDPDWVADQARALLEDMTVSGFKVGTPGSIANLALIAEIVSDYPDIPLVLDPFSSALPVDADDHTEMLLALRELLIPQTTLLLASAEELTALAQTWPDATSSDPLALETQRLLDSGCEYLFVTGTTSTDTEITNTLFHQTGIVRSDSWQRVPGLFHGAGTTLSATIAAMLARGFDASTAVLDAQQFTIAAIANAQQLGMGRLVLDRYFWTRRDDLTH